jgi:hypothetical protein
MWTPNSAYELEKLVLDGVLEEGSTLDFKKEVPSNSKELSKDVAAMANDGGVLIYGIGEDNSGQPKLLHPFRLPGVAERVDSIIRTTLSEPPEVDIRTLPTPQDSEIGYLVVLIPASPRAPHMVTVKGDNRFYGRTAKGNTLLNEGEIARLYQRRQQWEQDREVHLEKVISELHIPPNPDFGYAYLFSRPVVRTPMRLGALGERDTQRSVLYQLIQDVARPEVYQANFSPSFSGGRFKAISAGWKNNMGGEGQTEPRDVLDLEVHFDGEVRVFLGRAAERINQGLRLFEAGLAETAVRFLTFCGILLEKIHYFGPVDLGVAITGIKGASAWGSILAGYATRFDQDFYKETLRETSSQLDKDARAIAARLLSRLFHASGAVGSFDPLGKGS